LVTSKKSSGELHETKNTAWWEGAIRLARAQLGNEARIKTCQWRRNVLNQDDALPEGDAFPPQQMVDRTAESWANALMSDDILRYTDLAAVIQMARLPE
jgi:hypothetical protein